MHAHEEHVREIEEKKALTFFLKTQAHVAVRHSRYWYLSLLII